MDLEFKKKLLFQTESKLEKARELLTSWQGSTEHRLEQIRRYEKEAERLRGEIEREER